MKNCSKCKQDKPLEEFTKRSSSKDGYNSACKQCTRSYTQRHYRSNKQYYLDKNRKIREQLKLEFIEFIEFKKKLKCIDCGESRHWVLEFHHRNPEEKEGYIYQLFLTSKSKFEEELKKCDVLCANCHKDRHHKMSQ